MARIILHTITLATLLSVLHHAEGAGWVASERLHELLDILRAGSYGVYAFTTIAMLHRKPLLCTVGALIVVLWTLPHTTTTLLSYLVPALAGALTGTLIERLNKETPWTTSTNNNEQASRPRTRPPATRPALKAMPPRHSSRTPVPDSSIPTLPVSRPPTAPESPPPPADS